MVSKHNTGDRRLLFVDADDPDESALDYAVSLLCTGKILLYPTDTTYALGANALDTSAIGQVYRIKRRSLTKPLHIVVASLDMAERFAVVNDAAKALASEFLPGPLTIILPRKDTIPRLLVGGLNTVGIRIPDNKICLKIAQKAQVPFTTTSANVSGRGNPYTVTQVVEHLGPQIDLVDLILDQGSLMYREPSTIVDLTTTPPSVLREGSVSKDDIVRVLSRRRSCQGM